MAAVTRQEFFLLVECAWGEAHDRSRHEERVW